MTIRVRIGAGPWRIFPPIGPAPNLFAFALAAIVMKRRPITSRGG